MRIDAVVVDLGGVWLQDGSFAEREQWAAAHGLTADELFDAYLDAIGPGWEGGRSDEEIHRRLLAHVGVGADALSGLLQALHAHETLDPQLTEFLASLRPERQIGIITNAGPHARHDLCAKFPFDELADVMVVSAEQGVSKPDPLIYLAACEQLGVEPAACVFVDDKERNVVGARAVGMYAVRFTSTSQAIRDLSDILGRRSDHEASRIE